MIALRRLYFTGVLLCLGAMAVAGCGEVISGADAGPGDNIDATVAIDGNAVTVDAMPADPCTGNVAAEDMGECYLAALCDMYVRCLALFPNVDECKQSGGPFGGGGDPLIGLERILDAADAGKVIYHADRAGSCIAGFKAVTCEQLYTNSNIFGDCQDTFEGTVVGGGSCWESEECQARGANCQETTPCDLQCCLGTCEDPVALGQDCENKSCVEGSECVRNPTSGLSRCETGEATAPCQGYWDCDDEFWCDKPSGTPLGVCKPDFGSGAGCTEDEQCPGAEKCVGDDLNVTNPLGTCDTVYTAGDACDGRCDGPLWCDQLDDTVTGTCKALPGLNGDCGATASRGSCSGLLWCDSTDDTCKARKAANAPCTNNNECRLPLFCSADIPNAPSPGTCIAPQANGELCDSQQHCDSSICASNGTDEVCQTYQNCN